jgi:hypothetical protein
MLKDGFGIVQAILPSKSWPANTEFPVQDKEGFGKELAKGTKRLSNRQKHRLESRKLMAIYGQKFGFCFHIKSFYDVLFTGYRRMTGIIDMLKLDNRQQLAFQDGAQISAPQPLP